MNLTHRSKNRSTVVKELSIYYHPLWLYLLVLPDLVVEAAAAAASASDPTTCLPLVLLAWLQLILALPCPLPFFLNCIFAGSTAVVILPRSPCHKTGNQGKGNVYKPKNGAWMGPGSLLALAMLKMDRSSPATSPDFPCSIKFREHF